MFTAAVFISRRLPAAPDEDELSIRRSPCRRHQWSLTVLFACYININYSTERSADKQPGLFYLICKKYLISIYPVFFFFSCHCIYFITFSGSVSSGCTVNLNHLHVSSDSSRFFWSQHLIFLDWICCFVPIFNILKLYLLLPKAFQTITSIQCFPRLFLAVWKKSHSLIFLFLHTCIPE